MRSDCKIDSDRQYFDSLFDRNWEVFVVKRNDEKDSYDWFTLCCEAARLQSAYQWRQSYR